MRRLRFIPALLLILSACSKNVIEQTQPDSDMTGSVSISLSTDMRNEVVASKADADEPVLDDFRIAIYKTSNQMRLYNDSYANTVGKEIKLNAGKYRLVAQHGDSLGCGFNKPYYMADPEFEVTGRNTEVSAVAKLANVQLAVEYDATISEAYPDYYTVIRHNHYESKSIKFVKGESRYGYIPGGELVLEIYALVDGVWKSYRTEPASYKPNDFVTFTITSDSSEGNLVINIKVDGTTEDKTETVEIPAIMVPQAAPSITLAGFDGNGNTHEFVEGVEGTNAMASFVARGSIKSCVLTVDSEYLAGKGVPSEIDFTSLPVDVRAVLNAAGFAWDPNMKTSRKLSYIDFSGVISKMLSSIKSSEEDVVVARFGLKVEDSVGKSASSEFCIVSASVKPSLVIEDYNIWATKVVSPVITINKGNVSLVDLQVSSDQKEWNTLADTPSLNNYVLTYGTIAAEPGTTYYVRAIYNNNEKCTSPILTIRTEDAAQLGNSGFEDYQMVQTRFTPLASSSYTRNWYLPYASGENDPWWACNSMKSMPDNHTGWSVTWCKNFPSSGYVTDSHGGNKAAMVFCVNVGSTNTANSHPETTYEGEIWIGTADSNGNIATQGHAFASRPSKLAFYYKYTSNDGRGFFIDAWIKDAGGNIIASAQETAGQAASSWTRYELPFNYSTLTRKAASIYVRISSSYGDGYVGNGVEFALGTENVKAHAGCFLKLDDMELIYE